MRLTDRQIEQYSRQIILRELGGTGQRRLLDARIAVVGVGPTHDAAASYLVGAGIGRVDVADAGAAELPLAPLAERNHDVRIETLSPDPTRYDVILETGGGTGHAFRSGSARLGEVRVAETSRGLVLDLVPPTRGCLDCLASDSIDPAASRVDTLDAAQAGAMAALAVLRWMLDEETETDEPARRLQLARGAPTWTEGTLGPMLECPRPCRT